MIRFRLASCAVVIALGILAFAGPVLAADTYEIDSAHTGVLFKIDHLGFSDFYGRFNDVSGTFTVNEEDPAASTVRIEVVAESVDTGNERRDTHLRSPDFLSAAQFPKIVFESKSVKRTGEDYEIKGDLTLRGRTKPVTLKLHRNKTGEGPGNAIRTGFNGGFKIKRSEFGVEFMPGALGEDVELILAVEAVKKPAAAGG
jgi:polyisoprenoid-binding protein YceI